MDAAKQYVPIYRNGIPMLVPFDEIVVRDDVIISAQGDKVFALCGSKTTNGTCFFHDEHFAPWFVEDFAKVCIPNHYKGKDEDADRAITEINALLASSDETNAADVLRTHGYDQEKLTSYGFGFLDGIIKKNSGNCMSHPTFPATDSVQVGSVSFLVGLAVSDGNLKFCSCSSGPSGAIENCVYFDDHFDAVEDMLNQAAAAADRERRARNLRTFVPLNCKVCGSWLTKIDSSGIPYASSHYNGTDICDSCMVEHCVATNCLGCELGKYPDCKFLDMKQHYMSEDE